MRRVIVWENVLCMMEAGVSNYEQKIQLENLPIEKIIVNGNENPIEKHR